MTVAVVTVAIGETSEAFLPEWWAGVEALERQPDEVVVVTEGEWSPLRFNEAVARTSPGVDWVCKLDVDDVFFPTALNGLEERQVDVMVFGIRYGNLTWQPNGQNVLTLNDCNATAASPFRRKVWERGPFRDMPYWDWVFWIEAAHNGFTFEPSGRLDYRHRLHDGQITKPELHDERRRQVLDWKRALCGV